MPFVIITGTPCCGKTRRAEEIKSCLEKENAVVHIVSENAVIKSYGEHKNLIYSNAQKEKELRGVLKSESLRLLGTGATVILDAGNYIKGYRYELYCATKGIQTTQVTVECCVNEDEAWSWNETRDEIDRYSKEIFDALMLRYEPPNSQNRWDSPLIALQPDDECPADKVCSLLYKRKPPPPNMSTQCSITAARKLGLEGDGIKIPGFNGVTLDNFNTHQTPAQLARIRRQFLQYLKLNPPQSVTSPDQIVHQYIQFLNSNTQ